MKRQSNLVPEDERKVANEMQLGNAPGEGHDENHRGQT